MCMHMCMCIFQLQLQHELQTGGLQLQMLERCSQERPAQVEIFARCAERGVAACDWPALVASRALPEHGTEGAHTPPPLALGT